MPTKKLKKGDEERMGRLYPYHSNAWLANFYGISVSYVEFLATLNGWRKNKQYKIKLRSEQAYKQHHGKNQEQNEMG